MRHEKSGLKEQIAAVLTASFNITPKEMTFLPIGEESTSFKVTSGNTTYIVKWSEDTKQTQNMYLVHHLLQELSHFPFIVAPVQTPSGQTIIEMEEGYISVFPFIEGNVVDMPNEKFSKDVVKEITEIVIQIHNASSSLKTELPKETFNTTFETVFMNLLAESEKNKKTTYAPIVLHNKEKIQKLIDENMRHNEYYKQYKPHFVLTHGDITGLNFIQSKKGLVLIDWDDSIFAPKERDLPFLVCNKHFNLDYFIEKTGGTKYEKDLNDYYSLHWSLNSIVLGLQDLATQDVGEKDIQEKVREIHEYLGYY